MFYFYIFVVVCAIVNIHCQSPITPHDIRIDHYKVDTIKDLVINTARPRFSWKLSVLEGKRNVHQTAYQLQIKSHKHQWDSKQVMSSQSIHVSDIGFNDLESNTFYQFRLRIWTTQSNDASSWTEWIHFRTSIFNIHSCLMNKKDSLMWIGSKQITMNELRKEFVVLNDSPIQSAIVYISGLGYYELYANGKKIDTSRKLDPGWTVYEKRTLLVSFDLSSTIQVVQNDLL